MERILLLLLRMAWTRGSDECTVFHWRAVKGPRHAPCNRRENGALQITCSPACKRGTETIRCRREGRSKHGDGWRVPGRGEEWESRRLGIHWIVSAVTLVTALPLFSLGWTAGHWFMLPQLLAACANAQGEAAARPGREHRGWCDVGKWKFCPVQTVGTEDKVWA